MKERGERGGRERERSYRNNYIEKEREGGRDDLLSRECPSIEQYCFHKNKF
jgi:hypothetical protein